MAIGSTGQESQHPSPLRRRGVQKRFNLHSLLHEKAQVILPRSLSARKAKPKMHKTKLQFHKTIKNLREIDKGIKLVIHLDKFVIQYYKI